MTPRRAKLVGNATPEGACPTPPGVGVLGLPQQIPPPSAIPRGVGRPSHLPAISGLLHFARPRRGPPPRRAQIVDQRCEAQEFGLLCVGQVLLPSGLGFLDDPDTGTPGPLTHVDRSQRQRKPISIIHPAAHYEPPALGEKLRTHTPAGRRTAKPRYL